MTKTTKPAARATGKKAAPADVSALMRKVHRAAPGFPRVHVRMSESGLFYAELMRTSDQAREAAMADFQKRGESPAIDTFQAACDRFHDQPAITTMGKTAQEALVALLERVKGRG